jgi:hypothetical protein
MGIGVPGPPSLSWDETGQRSSSGSAATPWADPIRLHIVVALVVVVLTFLSGRRTI